MGTSAYPAALTQDAIAAATVESLGAVTLENDRLTVDETGYYYFGIHDISVAGGYSLYVDNFVIEEALPTMPLLPLQTCRWFRMPMR